MTFRTSEGDYAGYNRVPADAIGTTPPVGAGTIGSPVLNQAQALKLFNYVPPAPPVAPPSGFKFYRFYFSGYGTRLYLSEFQFSLAEVFDAGQLVIPNMGAVMTQGGNLASPSVLYDGAWPSPYWSGPTSGESGTPYSMVMFGLPQASPIRSVRVRTGGGGTAPDTARVDVTNDETAPGVFPFNGKTWTAGDIQSPSWTLFDAFNKYADLTVPVG